MSGAPHWPSSIPPARLTGVGNSATLLSRLGCAQHEGNCHRGQRTSIRAARVCTFEPGSCRMQELVHTTERFRHAGSVDKLRGVPGRKPSSSRLLTVCAVLSLWTIGCNESESPPCPDANCADDSHIEHDAHDTPDVAVSDDAGADPNWTPCCPLPEYPPRCMDGNPPEEEFERLMYLGGKRWTESEIASIDGVVLRPDQLARPPRRGHHTFDTNGCRVATRGFRNWTVGTTASENNCAIWIAQDGHCSEFPPDFFD